MVYCVLFCVCAGFKWLSPKWKFPQLGRIFASLEIIRYVSWTNAQIGFSLYLWLVNVLLISFVECVGCNTFRIAKFSMTYLFIQQLYKFDTAIVGQVQQELFTICCRFEHEMFIKQTFPISKHRRKKQTHTHMLLLVGFERDRSCHECCVLLSWVTILCTRAFGQTYWGRSPSTHTHRIYHWRVWVRHNAKWVPFTTHMLAVVGTFLRHASALALISSFQH